MKLKRITNRPFFSCFILFLAITLSSPSFAQENLPFPYDREWATYYGGYWLWSFGIAVDSRENIYIRSNVTAPNGLTGTPGTHQPNFAGMQDDMLTKFDTAGNLVWSTYFGGPDGEHEAGELVMDEENNIYITGYTKSNTNIATPGAHQESINNSSPVNNGNGDCYIAKFDTNGNLVWATYFGGENLEKIQSISLKDGFFYVVGVTQSSTNIATPGSYQSTVNPQPPGSILYTVPFIAKFSLDGDLIWSTYHGQFVDSLGANAVGIDANNNIYVVGRASPAASYLTTTGAYQTVNNGEGDIMVTKFNENGDKIWCTYYGGEENDTPKDIVIANNHLYITGYTASSTNIATTGVHHENLTAPNDAFLLKMDLDGNPSWGTYMGSQDANSLTVAQSVSYSDNSIWISGETNATNGISSLGAHQESYGGGDKDAFFAKFDENGQRLWGSYYGGEKREANFIANQGDNFYLAGHSMSTTGIATESAYQPNIGAGNNPQNVYLAKFVPKTLSTPSNQVKVFSIYPNPAEKYFQIGGNDTGDLKINIYTSTARLVKTFNAAKLYQKLELNLATGVYFVEIMSNENKETIRLVVK